MAKFLRINEMAFSVDRIELIMWHGDTVNVTLASGRYIVLHDREAVAFQHWWDNEADVFDASAYAGAERAGTLSLDAPERSQPGHRKRLFKSERDDCATGPGWGTFE